MKRRTRRGRLVAVAAVGALAALGYASWRLRPQTATPASHDARVAPLPLPDVSHLDARVQQQLRDRHAALLSALDAPQSSPADRAEAYGSLGMLLLAAEYPNEAAVAFQNAQTLAPADMRWPYYLGHVYRTRQEPARAIPMFERALELSPDHVPSLIWLGDLHLASGNAAAAEAPLQRALRLAPTSAAAASRLGRAALARREYARAAEFLTRALELEPQAGGVHYSLGLAYRGLGETSQAEAHLQQARGEGDPAPADPLLAAIAGVLEGAGAFEARGMAALDARDWTTAVANLRQAVALAPANAVTRLNLGTALSLAGDTQAAERELLEAVRLDPRSARAHFALGILAQDAGRWADAIARFTAAVQHDSGLVDARFALAEALRRTGRSEDAVARYREVIALNPAASQARFGQAMALVGLRRFAAARAVLEEAVQVHPDQPGLPHALARILAAAPEPDVRDGRRALALMQPLVAPDTSPAVGETMAMVMAELGRYDEAVEWQERAIRGAASAGQSALSAQMQDNLRLYQQRQPCRTPWRQDDPVIAVVASR